MACKVVLSGRCTPFFPLTPLPVPRRRLPSAGPGSTAP